MLVIVDMQPDFEASFVVLEQVLKAVDDAVSLNVPVVVLEYKGTEFGTYGSIRQRLKGHQHFFATKADDDGSSECLRVVERKGLKPPKTLLCGVNGSCCVRATWMGLLPKRKRGLAEVSVLAGATACAARPHTWQGYFADGGVWGGNSRDYFRSSPASWAAGSHFDSIGD